MRSSTSSPHFPPVSTATASAARTNTNIAPRLHRNMLEPAMAKRSRGNGGGEGGDSYPAGVLRL